MLNSKSNVRNIGDILGKIPSSFTFQDPPLIDAPYTTITDLSGNPRKIPDPSKTLRPAMGPERILIKSLSLKKDEKGPNGELVWEPQNKDSRVRFVGTWVSDNSNLGQHLLSTVANDFVEISFYGTGLNLALFIDGTSRDLRATVDGGAEGANFYITGSNTIGNRQYASNIIFPLVSGLALGNHTVKIRQNTGSTNFRIFGFEVLNQSTQIKVPQGEIFSNGLKYTNSALQSIDYNTGFDGSPVLNGRGGRVVEYITPSGRIGKVIQQTNASQANLSSSDHTNEELIRKINFREFGANRADDFSTLGGSSARAFTLDDGTTTLVGDAVTGATINNVDSFYCTGTGNFFTITFVGTGFDFFQTQSSVARDLAVSVNGSSIGTIAAASLLDRKIIKVVSGLPFGTHTIKFTQQAGGTGPTFSDFFIYGPKKPTIPANSIQLNEYYLMADFVANSTASINYIATGVLRKQDIRELLYVDGSGGTSSWAVGAMDVSAGIAGFTPNTDRTGAYVEYTFFGTGFDFRYYAATNRSANIQVMIDGVNANTTNYPSMVSSQYGAGSFTAATGILSQNGTNTSGSGLRISNLSLGKHTVRLTNNTASSFIEVGSFDIITPVHFPNTKLGSLSMGPAVQLKSSEEVAGIDLSKAKAWLSFDGVNNFILGNYNISGILRNSTGNYNVYFEKPFKGGNTYSSVCTPANSGASEVRFSKVFPNIINIQFFTSASSAVDSDFSLACFGELEDEE